MSIQKEGFVVNREQCPLEGREHRQFILGPLDGGERRSHRVHFFAAVERLAADEQMGNAARLERVDICARDVLAVMQEAAKQDADMSWLDWHGHRQLVSGRALGDQPPALAVQPVDESADSHGQRLLGGVTCHATLAVRLGTGNTTTDGCPAMSVRYGEGDSETYLAWSVCRFPVITG